MRNKTENKYSEIDEGYSVENNISIPNVIKIVQVPVPAPIEFINISVKIEITLNEYISQHNRNRNLDNVIRKWFFANNKTNPNPKKSKEEWDTVINSFYNETEK